MLNEKIHSGEIEIGENIVEREYKKLVSNELGDLMTQTFPLSKLRIKLFRKHCKFMRLNSDAYFENLEETELNQRLSSLGELNLDRNIEDKKENLKKYERSRHCLA